MAWVRPGIAVTHTPNKYPGGISGFGEGIADEVGVSTGSIISKNVACG